MSAWLKIEPVYEAILRYVKNEGIKVYHRKIKGGAGGYFDVKKCIITIDESAKGKVAGCYYLLHEKKHYDDWRVGKFPYFFRGFDDGYNEKNLQMVIDAEMSAIIGAHKELKKWGIDYQPSEMSEGGLNETIIFWKKHYFGVV